MCFIHRVNFETVWAPGGSGPGAVSQRLGSSLFANIPSPLWKPRKARLRRTQSFGASRRSACEWGEKVREYDSSVAEEKAATNSKGTQREPECLHCGWGVVPDLSQRFRGGAVLYECKNPFRCFERSSDIWELF